MVEYVKVGIDDEVYAILVEVCEAEGISKPEYIRRALGVVLSECNRSAIVRAILPPKASKAKVHESVGIQALTHEFEGYFSTWDDDERYSGATSAAIRVLEALSCLDESICDAIHDSFDMFIRMLRSGHITRQDLVGVLEHWANKTENWNGYPLACPSGCGRKWTRYAPYAEGEAGYNPLSSGLYACTCGSKGTW